MRVFGNRTARAPGVCPEEDGWCTVIDGDWRQRVHERWLSLSLREDVCYCGTVVPCHIDRPSRQPSR